MSKIKLLDKRMCELISAGEVVERPASAVKELIENALDAGATSIEIELKRNGMESIRVTDNGAGIDRADVPAAFVRHATSKIASEEDLGAISTLGFRGEALAAISAVSKLRLLTKTRDAEYGTEYVLHGGEKVSLDDAGAVAGTTIFVNEIFYNTPARMKFLKNDVSEGNAVQQTVEQLALAHPETAFSLIRDKRQAVRTPGDGSLFSAIYAIFPKEISDELIEVNEFSGRYGVSGYVGTPRAARKSRGWQYLFVNGRYIKSRSLTAAVEEANRSLVPSGSYPPFVLNLAVPFELVDVNVHPQKTEVRFSSERDVFGAVYTAVKNALMSYSGSFESVTHGEKPQTAPPEAKEAFAQKSFASFEPLRFSPAPAPAAEVREQAESYVTKQAAPLEITGEPPKPELRVIGEAFKTYIICEYGDELVLIDKHAAHERILFESVDVAAVSAPRQLLAEPVLVSLPLDDKQALLEQGEKVERAGFLAEEFGNGEIAVREIPVFMPVRAVPDAISEIAAQLKDGFSDVAESKTEWLIHSVSCRTAIKAGHRTSDAELLALAQKIIDGSVPKFCPHGRPVTYVITRSELERRFGRG